jgi:hypothetical protein
MGVWEVEKFMPRKRKRRIDVPIDVLIDVPMVTEMEGSIPTDDRLEGALIPGWCSGSQQDSWLNNPENWRQQAEQECEPCDEEPAAGNNHVRIQRAALANNHYTGTATGRYTCSSAPSPPTQTRAELIIVWTGA